MPGINLLSLFLGILVGVVALLLFLKFKSKLPEINTSRFKRPKHDRISENSELLLRKHLLRKVQSLHIASDLVPLNTIYIPQKLYSHPLYAAYGDNIDDEPLFFREALQIADVPELASTFPLPVITLNQAISNRKNIAVSGTIGSGKTTCLAKLASEILEYSPKMERFSGYLPIYLDIRALTCQENPGILIDAVALALFSENDDLIPRDIIPVLTTALNKSHLLLLIDQLDEITPDHFRKAVRLLQQYHSEYPRVQMITTCGPYYVDGLDLAGFSVLPIKPPDINDYHRLITTWFNALGSLQRSPVEVKTDISESQLKQLWLKQTIPTSSFFDLTTLILSGVFHGINQGNSSINHYLLRTTKNPLTGNILQQLADWSAEHDFSGITEKNLTDLITRTNEKNTGPENNPNDAHNFMQKLVTSNLLHSIGGSYFFCNPSLLCRLLSFSTCISCSYKTDDLLHFSLMDSITRYKSYSQDYLVEWIQETKLQETKSISIFLNHLFNPDRTPPNLSFAFPDLAKRILSSSTPLSTKIKLASVIYYTKPAQLMQLLSRLESQVSDDLRKLCAFFYGLSPINQHIDFLLKCATDNNPSVKVYGLVSLVNNLDQETTSLLSQIIRSSKDDTGKIAAELLAQNEVKGHHLLRELMADEGSVSRRNVIYGLRLIDRDWADQLLKEINSNDKAWIIRDAAAITLENKWDPTSYAPRPLGNPANDPKLLRIASARAQGIPANSYPLDFLVETLNSNRYDEKLLAIQYLSAKPNDDSIEVFEILSGQDNPVREVVCQVLYEHELKT